MGDHAYDYISYTSYADHLSDTNKFLEYMLARQKKAEADTISRPVQTNDVIENIVAAMQDGTASWESQEDKEILADLLVELIRRRKGLL